jgi:hypothetical protein
VRLICTTGDLVDPAWGQTALTEGIERTSSAPADVGSDTGWRKMAKKGKGKDANLMGDHSLRFAIKKE